MYMDRSVPRLPFNLWELAANGQVSERDVTCDGRLRERVGSGDDLLRAYEDALRRIDSPARTWTPPPPTPRCDVDDLRERVSALEREIVGVFRALRSANISVVRDPY